MKRTVLPRVFMSMFVLMTALCMMAQPVAQRQRKDAPRKTMKQFADEFEAKRKKCNKVITAGDLKASKSMNAPTKCPVRQCIRVSISTHCLTNCFILPAGLVSECIRPEAVWP